MKTDLYQLVTDINRAFEQEDTAFLAAYLAEDVQWDVVGKKPIHGKNDFLKCCSEAPFKHDSIKVTLNQVLVDGNRAAADGRIEAETLAGKPFRQSFCDLYEFEGGLIKTMRSYVVTPDGI